MMQAQPGWRRNLNLFVDVTDVENVQLDFPAMIAAAEMTSSNVDQTETAPKPRFSLCYETEHHYAMGRMMFAVMDRLGRFDCEMFTEEKAALAWLGCKDLKFSTHAASTSTQNSLSSDTIPKSIFL